MTIFKQPVAMKCTQEQYEADLKKPLLDLGYQWGCDFERVRIARPYLVTYFASIPNALGVMTDIDDRWFNIEIYNPQLFLAIAAMTLGKEVIVGEYMIAKKDYYDESWGDIEKGNIKMAEPDSFGTTGNIIADDVWGKATLQEIVSHFEKEAFFERGERVLVRDEDEDYWKERTYLTTIDGSEAPFIVVYESDKDNYRNKEEFAYTGYRQIKKKPLKEEINISISINGKQINPKDISEETWKALRE